MYYIISSWACYPFGISINYCSVHEDLKPLNKSMDVFRDVFFFLFQAAEELSCVFDDI